MLYICCFHITLYPYTLYRLRFKEFVTSIGNMLFYDKEGKLVQINKLNFINDKQYYNHIMKSRCYVPRKQTTDNKYAEVDRIVNMVLHS